ncbi:MAG TPA: phosphatase PAP2 family protein [Chloroflexota bacterium]|nr:phosphatase PAP2 family protein [Chloroflexota bacterium]
MNPDVGTPEKHDFNDVEMAVAQPLNRMVGRLWHLGINLLIIFVLEKVYEFGRGLVPKQHVLALHNGLFVVQIEESWNIFDEWHLQAIVFRHKQWLIGPLTINRDQVISLINHFYLYSHFLGTLFFLAWVYLFRQRFFGLVRDIIFITTGLALIIYIAFPMMPPRLMGSALHLPHGYRFIDTLAPILNYKLQQAQIGYNPYAAMPSLHFAWALILGVTLVLIGGHPLLRIFGLLYPVMMLATIVISGNHLFLDAAGSVIVVTIATVAAGLWHLRGTSWNLGQMIGNGQAA